jgi:hypothetical protein
VPFSPFSFLPRSSLAANGRWGFAHRRGILYLSLSMVGYFPRHNIAWKVEEPAAFRALTLSVVESGLLAGVVLHLVHALALAYIPEGRWVLFSLLDAVLFLALFAVAAVHLANYPLRQWVWRAPLFATLAALGGAGTSLVLIAIHRERLGSARADWDDWPSMSALALAWNTVSVCVFALLLAVVVHLVRSALIRREQRDMAVEAVHRGPPG